MAMLLPRRRESDVFSAAFVSAIGMAASPGAKSPATLVGLEHEFRVLAAGRALDFGRLIHALPIDGRRVDPADPNAYRGSWGGAITSDGREAEIAIPPVATVPGFTTAVASLARLGQERLRVALPPGTTLEGYSTHLNVAVPDRLVERAARLYLDTFGPALMLLLDGPASPGLLVRPRPGRLELCGEFASGERLRAAVAFVAGSVRAVANAAGRPILARRGLPPAVVVTTEPARDRFGWFIAPTSVASDFYPSGRRAELDLRGGGTISAQEHLERCWAVARAALGGDADAADVAAMDRIVAGTARLGVEHEQASAIAQQLPQGPSRQTAENPFGALLRPRRRGELLIEPELVTWDFAVLRVASGVRTGFLCLPRASLGPGLEALDSGRLDGVLRDFLAAPVSHRVLASNRQTATAGLFGAVGHTARLLATERSPLGDVGDRPGKRRRDHQQDQPDTPDRSSHSNDSSLATTVKRPAAAGVAGGVILGLSLPVAAALAGASAIVVVGGALLVGGGLGGGAASPVGLGSPSAAASAPVVVIASSPPTSAQATAVPSLATAVPSLATLPPSPVVTPPPAATLPPASVIALASPSQTTPPVDPVAGTFELAWTVVSAKAAPGYDNEIGYPPGSTGTQRVVVTCDPAGCIVTPVNASGEREDARPPPLGYLGPWSRTPTGLAGTMTRTSPNPACANATSTITATWVGRDPMQVNGATVFGQFAGQATVKNARLQSGTCRFQDTVTKFTATRVKP